MLKREHIDNLARYRARADKLQGHESLRPSLSSLEALEARLGRTPTIAESDRFKRIYAKTK